MSAAWTVLQLLTAFAVFAASTWQLLITWSPGPRKRERLVWVAWGGCHIGIAVGMLGVILRDITGSTVSPWYELVARVCISLLLVIPWHREIGV